MNDDGSTTDSDSRAKVDTRVRWRGEADQVAEHRPRRSHLIALFVERDALGPRRLELRDQRLADRTRCGAGAPATRLPPARGSARRRDRQSAPPARRGSGCRRARSQLERLRAEPSADGGGELRHRAGRGRIVTPIRRDQAVEREHHRRPGAAAALVVIAIVARRGSRAAARPDRPSAAIRCSGASARAAAKRGLGGRRARLRSSVCAERAQAIEPAEVALLRHRHIERRDRRAIELRAFELET